MTRNEMIEQMINFAKSTPEDASNYHRYDMLLSRMERLGMLPPPNTKVSRTTAYNYRHWNKENELD